MADCGESDYQAVEYSGLFDLKGAQILRAEINSIDAATNTADITLLDACEAYASRDLSEVEFFYHCEDSTGTVEDLEKGWKAFKPLDIVYVLAVPARGETPERFHVVGHVDIRGTKRCLMPEYLYIQILTGSEEVKSFFCIFDTVSGTTLDIKDFTNLDELSPAKPASAYGVKGADVQPWVDYNFEPTPSPQVIVPYARASKSLPPWNEVQASSTRTTIPYTGTSGFIFGSNPIDCAAWFSAGNSEYKQEISVPMVDVYGTSNLYYGDMSAIRHNSGSIATHANLGLNSCIQAWEHTSLVCSKTQGAELSQSDYYLAITDTLNSVNYTIKVTYEQKETNENYTTLDGDGDFYAKGVHTISYTVDCVFSSFSALSTSYSFSSRCEQEYIYSGFNVPSSGSPANLTGGTMDVYGMFDTGGPPAFINTKPSPVLIGHKGFYIVAGVANAVHRYGQVDGGHLFQQQSAKGGFSYPRNPEFNSPPAPPPGYFNVGINTYWQDAYYYEIDGETFGVSHLVSQEVRVTPCCTVSLFKDDVVPGDTVSLTSCLQHPSVSQTEGLNDTLFNLYKDHWEWIAENVPGARADAYLSSYVSPGPTVSVMRKKPNA